MFGRLIRRAFSMFGKSRRTGRGRSGRHGGSAESQLAKGAVRTAKKRL